MRPACARSPGSIRSVGAGGLQYRPRDGAWFATVQTRLVRATTLHRSPDSIEPSHEETEQTCSSESPAGDQRSRRRRRKRPRFGRRSAPSASAGRVFVRRGTPLGGRSAEYRDQMNVVRPADTMGAGREEDASQATLRSSHVPVEARGLALGILATLATAFALSWAQTLLIPLLLGVVITYTLSPVVGWLERLRIPRVAGSVLVMGTVIAALVLGAYSLRDQLQTIVEQLPVATAKLSVSLAELRKSQRGNLQKIESAATAMESATTGTAWRSCPAAGHARRRRSAEVQAQRLPVGKLGRRHRGGGTGGDGRVPGVLPAARWRHVQAQAGAARRPHAVEAEDHRHDSRRHQPLDPEVHVDAGRDESADRPAQLDGVPLHRHRQRRSLGRRRRPAAPGSLSRPGGGRRRDRHGGVHAVRLGRRWRCWQAEPR